ncbi:uncharacterized protein F5891DRAFT_975664 [Suillus fuscotomentosus]|uniref:Uncharacterized protein n=1 Tax=Suillus fuscotomentosus TaxID=1912939 RepID=A0AAD4HRU0_9AGAM|nr:uncharacterized protein F5891DRAFT_975664 [Suillus fuscotomentosus]KAG1906236.1 hypothetical protein F5891DRAFT_975664 [Suillus fuscotomentosus]
MHLYSLAWRFNFAAFANLICSSVIPSSNKRLHPDDTFVNIEDNKSVDKDHDSVREDARTNPKPRRKKQKAPEKSPELVDGDGVFIDIDVSIADPGSSREGKTADINTFFGATFEQTGANGKVKKHRKCSVCP